MTHKQKKIQKQYVPRQSIDAVDNAAELYQQFDAELEELLQQEDGFDDAVKEDWVVTNDVKQGDTTLNAEEYIKENHFSIQFQGEKKARKIGTKEYSDSQQARDEALARYTAEISKKELQEKRETQMVHKEMMTDGAIRKSSVDTAIENQKQGGRGIEEVSRNDVKQEGGLRPVDLDTGATFGGRAALAAELAQQKETSKVEVEDKKYGVVRLNGGASVREMHKERPQEQQEAIRNSVELVYNTRAKKQKKENVAQQKQDKGIQKENNRAMPGVARMKKSRPQKAVPKSVPQRPTVYQLGQPVPQTKTAQTIVASQYVPQAHRQQKSPAEIGEKKQENPVTFFKRAQQLSPERAHGRAHASIGSATFTAPNNKSAGDEPSFSDVAQRVRQAAKKHDEVDFLATGKITFADAQEKKGIVQKPEIEEVTKTVQKEVPPKAVYKTVQKHAQKKHKKQAVSTSGRRNFAPKKQVLKHNGVASVAREKLQTKEVRRENRAEQKIKEELRRQAQKRLQMRQPMPKKKVIQQSERIEKRKDQGTSREVVRKKSARSVTFVATIIIISAIIIIGALLFQRGTSMYTLVKGAAERGFGSLQTALADVKQQDFAGSQKSFQSASYELGRASASFAQINGGVVAITQYIPFLSKLSSGKNAIAVGQHIAQAGTSFSKAGQVLKGVGNPLEGGVSILEMYQEFAEHVTQAQRELILAQELMGKIVMSDVPQEHRAQFVRLKEKLPVILEALERFQDSNHVIADLLGANGPRKYLFLFQNNHEMRATGGFIGSYGRLDISGGEVRQFFIDGIFNPDGQLTEKVVPPKPIQKISAAWSLHDSNWFPHFPTSAEEAIVFYERTGGPTVDGVIAITPVVLERLLAVTGPVHLPGYDADITSENFMERLQQEVEIDYDKEENRPKKILSDLAPIILARIFETKNGGDIKKVLDVMGQMLVERHIQLYARNKQVQKWITTAGWGGAIADVPYDFLSVINTNINGYKTDGVVDETIYHWAEIQGDGSIIDTVRIVRKHNGGNTPYEWWNKVNANYMRVFVPEGSELISVTGQTREFVEPPLDYRALGFQSDAKVVIEEQGMTVDDATGTRIYTQNNKTVFANWVYVSPQETVTIEYTYKLPFKVSMQAQGDADTYSILFQKQAGSVGSKLVSHISLPQTMTHVWSHPESMGDAQWETVLTKDRLRGIVIVPSGQ